MRALFVLGFVVLFTGGCKQRPDSAERVPIRRKEMLMKKAKTDVEAAQQKEEKRDDKIVEQAK